MKKYKYWESLGNYQDASTNIKLLGQDVTNCARLPPMSSLSTCMPMGPGMQTLKSTQRLKTILNRCLSL